MKTLLLLLITIFLLFEQSGCGQTDSTNEYYSNQRKLAEEQEKKNEEWAKKHSTKEDTEKVFKVFNDRPDIVYYLHIPYSFDPPKSTSNKDEITPNSINNPFDTLDLHLDLTLDRTKKIHKIQFRTYAKNTVITVNDSTYLSKIKNKLKTKPIIESNFIWKPEARFDVIDITGLTTGNYYINYISGGLHGIFLLTIK